MAAFQTCHEFGIIAILLKMFEQRTNKLNWLQSNLPEGLVVDASWLAKHDYPTSLTRYYVAVGKLER